MKTSISMLLASLLPAVVGASAGEPLPKTNPWQVGTPIATYWAGPTLDDKTATQMAEGGFNLVWCGEAQLDVARRHGLRAHLQHGLLRPESLDDPARRQELDAFIDRVKNHPALYSYHLIDEPGAPQFPALGKLVKYLRERDPAHLAYLNLFPTYANNQQLGTMGDTVTAYRDYLRQFADVVKPALVSYDHYQFQLKGDGNQYFLNLAMIRRTALDLGVPFLNIVQACTWAPQSMRIPNADELRYLVYTTIAYGAQGISYYVYAHPGHHGSIANLDGTPGPLYHALKSYNREFVALAKELQPLRSLAVYHTAMKEPGCEPPPADPPFRLEPVRQTDPNRGFLMGWFSANSKPTHVVLVNLDYRAEATIILRGPAALETFDATAAKWSPANQPRIELKLPPGGGKLVRAARQAGGD